MLAWCTIFFLLLCSIEAQGGKGLATLATSRPRNTGRQSHPRLQLSNYQTVILSKLQHPSVPPYLFILRVSPKAQASAFKSFHSLASRSQARSFCVIREGFGANWRKVLLQTQKISCFLQNVFA